MTAGNSLSALESIDGNIHFIESIINAMFDWVRVIDRENNILFINRAMAEGLGGQRKGMKCYNAIGRTEPCGNCISRKAVFDGIPHEKEEIINGRIYSVMSSPVRDEYGKIVAVVEVLRDITQSKQIQKQLLSQNKILQDDLAMAKKLQCSLLPKNLSQSKINFSFLYKPCEALGGDFLDIFMIDNEHTGIYIADVSGHGVPASMLTVFLRSSINKKTLSPADSLLELFYEFNTSNFDQDIYISVFYLIINTETKQLTYSNAGHNVSPFIFSRNSFELLKTPGIPISNWMEKPEYFDKTTSLNTGDRVFLYTDGVVEIRNSGGEQYGEERLLDVLLNDTTSPSGTLNNIVSNACHFAGISNTANVPDDITLALLEIK